MRMPAAVALTTLLLVSSIQAEGPDAEFPYSAFAAADATAVRSGPGEQFYPVLGLRRGDAVEVWRHDAGGWCAVRPPEGSFSWISADFVRRAGDRLGVVVGEQVNVRIGTTFGELRDAVQLQLGDGDQVEILETQETDGPAGIARWYKIAPPAGEFRFVHRSQLASHPNELVDSIAATSATTNDVVRPAAYVAPAGGDDGSTEAAAAELRKLSDDAGSEDVLARMEVVLSRMVAAEPTTWNFSDLQRRGEGLLERATTAVERSRIRLFLAKVARFDDIRLRYARLAETRTQTALVDEQLRGAAGESAARSQAPRVEPSTDVSRYDGVGRLSQIVLAADAAPTYALSDDRGTMIAYVTAAPGVNLRQYVGLDVGINGIKGFVPEERMARLTAKRVDVLTARGEPLGVQRR